MMIIIIIVSVVAVIMPYKHDYLVCIIKSKLK